MESQDLEVLQSFDSSFMPPDECGNQRCLDLFPDFLFTVVTPVAVVVLLLFVLSIIMCCSFSRLRKLSESEDMLTSYDAVRRASATVRHISHANNTPLLSSRSGSMTLVRDQRLRRGFRPRDSCHSAPGTLQRHHRNRDSTGWQNSLPPPPPPPAYGGPPAYPLDDDDAFLGPDIPLQDFHEADVRHAEGHRRQRPYSTSDGYMTG